MKPLDQVETLKELLSYDSETGLFTWRVTMNSRAPAGKVAGSDMYGYTQINSRGCCYAAHRLAWLYVHGVLPSGEIDHINGDKKDNRIANLRDVPHAINQQNRRQAHRKSSGLPLGVTLSYKARSPFKAMIQVAGKAIYLGIYGSPEQAHSAYVAAKRQMHSGCTI